MAKEKFTGEKHNKSLRKNTTDPSNKNRQTKQRELVINAKDLKLKGFSDRAIAQLTRYVILKDDFNSQERRFKRAIKWLKDEKYKDIVKQIEEQFTGYSIWIDDVAIVNLTKKKTAEASAKNLRDKLMDKFADVMQKYNIDLDGMIEEIKTANQKFTTHWEIETKNPRKMSEASLRGVYRRIREYLSGLYHNISFFVTKLLKSRSKVEDVIEQLMEEPKPELIEEGVKDFVLAAFLLSPAVMDAKPQDVPHTEESLEAAQASNKALYTLTLAALKRMEGKDKKVRKVEGNAHALTIDVDYIAKNGQLKRRVIKFTPEGTYINGEIMRLDNEKLLAKMRKITDGLKH
jgi:hypothetical protein